MESRRQQQVAGISQHEISDIFQKSGRNYYGSSFVTISGVKVTPDLLVARIFISVLSENERKGVVESLKQHSSDIRRQLGNKVKNQLTGNYDAVPAVLPRAADDLYVRGQVRDGSQDGGAASQGRGAGPWLTRTRASLRCHH